MNEQPTPETDAQCYDCTYRGDMGGTFTACPGKNDPYGDHVSADFARKLERERDEARAKLARIHRLVGVAEQAKQEELGAMREAIKEAYTDIAFTIHNHNLDGETALERAALALAKLKPFITP